MKVQLFADSGSGAAGGAVPFSEIYLPEGLLAGQGARRLAAALCQKWGCSCVIHPTDKAVAPTTPAPSY